jgi:hypothetical protein
MGEPVDHAHAMHPGGVMHAFMCHMCHRPRVPAERPAATSPRPVGDRIYMYYWSLVLIVLERNSGPLVVHVVPSILLCLLHIQ